MLLWNVRGWISKKAELRHEAIEYDITILTETKSKKRDYINIRGFNCHMINNYQREEGGAGGVAILIRKNIKCQIIDFSDIKSSIDVIGIRVRSILLVYINILEVTE